MRLLTEYGAFLRRYGLRSRSPLSWLFIILTTVAYLLAKNDNFHAKFFENESLRVFLKVLLYIVTVVFFVIAVALDIKAYNEAN